MQIEGKKVKLKIGDVLIFRANDGVVQVARGGQRLLNQHADDKSIVSNDLPLSQTLCLNIANIIAMTHGFDAVPLEGTHLHSSLYYYKLTRLKKVK